MTTTSPTPHQREHDQHPQRDTRQIEPCDWADALSAQARTDTRLVHFCLGVLAGALFCLGYLAGQNSQNDARPSAYPYPVAAPIPAAPGGPAAATPTPVVPTALNTALSTVPAQAPTPATRTLEPVLPLSSESAAALPAVSAPMRPGAGALAFIGSSDASGRCDAPTGRDRDSRGSVVRAGPVTVSGAGIDLVRPAGPDLATERCDDPATTHPASSHDNNSTKNSTSDPGDDSGKDKNHKDKNGQQRDRNGWDWPSDPPGWPGWRGDGPPPYNYAPGYVPGYGPGYGYGYGPGWGPGSAPGYGPYGYNYPSSGNRGDRGELGMCRVYRPGALRDLPDGGLVCTRDDQPTR
jgi:hypothetical protein